MHFDKVPTFFRLLDAATIVGNIWHVLTLRPKLALEASSRCTTSAPAGSEVESRRPYRDCVFLHALTRPDVNT